MVIHTTAMKRLGVIAAMLVVGTAAQAQTDIGLIASGFINDVDVVNVTEPGNTPTPFIGAENRVGFSVGGFAQTNYDSWLTTRMEVNYTNTGFNTRNTIDNFLVGKYTIHYVQISPMIGARVKRGFSLFTGPTLNAHIGSSSRGQVITTNDLGQNSPTGQWINVRGLLEPPKLNTSVNISEGMTRPLVLGWQVQAGYTYKHFSVHVRRQWHVQPMGGLSFPFLVFGPTRLPSQSRNDFTFRSWQYGLSYTLFRPKSRPPKLKAL